MIPMRINCIKRDFLYLVAGFFSLLVVWVTAFFIGVDVNPLPAELRAKIPKGRTEMAKEPFLQTPFVVDSILDNNDVDFLFYQRPPGQLDGLAEHAWRIYASGESAISLGFSYIDPAKSTPRVWLYDASGQLIQSGIYKSANGGKNGTFFLTIPSPGMYKVKLNFPYENVFEIRASGKNRNGVLPYKDYIKDNTKKIDLIIVDSELQKLQSLVEKAKSVWNEPKPNDVFWPRYLGVKGEILGTLKTKTGANIYVTIGLAGRSPPHLPAGDSPLPSLDIKVLSGPLPYGLQRFKLYTLTSKDLSEIIHNYTLEDYGVMTQRHDRADVTLNGKPVGQMLLMDTLDAQFFEAAQRIDGPVFVYDSDVLEGDFYNHKLQVKNIYGKNKKDEELPDLASPEFAKKVARMPILLMQSYGLAYAAIHGMGQGDVRYHWDSRSGTFDPIAKDLDAGTLAPAPGQFITSWSYFNLFAPLWRPNAASEASYYVVSSSKDKAIYAYGGGLFLWHTPPSTLSILEDKNNIRTIGELNHMWASQWSRLMVRNRFDNLHRAMGDNVVEPPIKLTQDILPEPLWDPSRYKPSRDVVRVGKLIGDVTAGRVNPTTESLATLDWRNAAIRQIYGEPSRSDTEPIQFPVLTFLYRTEEPGLSHIILAERSPQSSEIKVRLKNTEGIIFEPKATRFYAGEKKLANVKEIELSDIKENEAVRLYWFDIKRKNKYQYVFPVIDGPGRALTPREMVVGPKYGEAEQPPVSNLANFFEKKEALLTLRKEHPPIDGEVIIPSGDSWFIESDTTIKFRKNGCLKIYGDLRIADGASLTLTPEIKEDGWSGIHFFSGDDRVINNLHVEGAGYGVAWVACGKSKFGGGVSFYNTNVSISNSWIKNSRTGDALHVLYSEADINNLLVDSTSSNCLDSDFSVLRISNSRFKSCGVSGKGGGDGVNVSGSLLHMDNIEALQAAGKGISAGENSVVYVNKSRFVGADIGIASKDASTVSVTESLLENNRVGLSAYSKKPYFPESKLDYDKSVTFAGNQINVSLHERNQTSQAK